MTSGKLRLALVAVLTACSSASTGGGADEAALRAVLTDVHFVEWIECDSTRYGLDPISAPPAYQDEKPFFYSALEGYATAPDGLSRELLESLRARNAEGTPLPQGLGRDSGLALKATGARVWLSLPGYDAEGNAAVSVTRNAAGDCPGAGYVVVLRRAGNSWTPSERPVEWVD